MQRWLAWIVAALAIVLTVDAGMKEVLADGDRREKDSAGKEWLLKEWSEEEGRPYRKLLKEREELYRKKWGEDWYGPKSTCRILSPGSWKWEVVFTVPPDLAKKISSGNKPTHANIKTQWGARFWGMCFVWGPGGGDVTDIYALADDAIIHYDPVSRRIDVIGNPDEPGVRDGVNGDARLKPGDRVTLDPVTGRLYFIQGKSWRYVEKLVPFACSATGKVYHLPAVLAWNRLYLKVKSPAGASTCPSSCAIKRRAVVASSAVEARTVSSMVTCPGAPPGWGNTSRRERSVVRQKVVSASPAPEGGQADTSTGSGASLPTMTTSAAATESTRRNSYSP